MIYRNTIDTLTLAVDGGTPVRSDPWPVRRLFGEREKAAVMDLFDRAMEEGSHLLGYNGEQETSYCREFAASLGGGYADAVNSGTNAVYVALRSLDLEPYTEVIVPALTDAGGLMPIPLTQCIPIPVDAAPGSYNTGVEQIAEKLTDRTRAIVVAHISGIPVDMDPILELASSRGIPVLQDCAQAHGATYKGRAVGSLGEVASFSTMFGKHHATGGQGGVVFTRDEARYWRIRQMADRGKPFGLPGAHTNVVAALNCNMDELHAAIGCVQLQRLPEMVAWRRQLARHIERRLEHETDAVRLATGPADSESSYWFLVFHVDFNRLNVDKTTFSKAVAAEGIPLQSGYWHVPATYEWFRNRAVFGTSGLPWSNAGSHLSEAELDLPNLTATEAAHVTLSIHEGCGMREADDVVEALRKVEAVYRR